MIIFHIAMLCYVSLLEGSKLPVAIQEEEVTPAFRYIQRIRSEEMDQRR